MGLLTDLAQKVPRWMVTAPRAAFLTLMAGPAALVNGIGEIVYQARIASLPGQIRQPGIPGLGGFDSVDALFYIARDRRVFPAQVFGLPWVTEKPWQLAERLRNWRDDWVNNVGAFGLLTQIAYALVPTVPVLRCVQVGGMVFPITSWFTRHTDGSFLLQRSDTFGFSYNPATGALAADTTAAQQWDWDSHNDVISPDQSDFNRCWIISYVPAGSPYLTTTDATFADPGTAGDAWNDPTAQVDGQPTAGTVGTNAPLGFVTLVQNIIVQRETAGAPVLRFIVAFDAASFNPDGSSAAGSSLSAYPNGRWGWDSSWDSGTNHEIVTRLQTARYWLGDSSFT